jgi:CTD small phosphatase-like protein 2
MASKRPLIKSVRSKSMTSLIAALQSEEPKKKITRHDKCNSLKNIEKPLVAHKINNQNSNSHIEENSVHQMVPNLSKTRKKNKTDSEKLSGLTIPICLEEETNFLQSSNKDLAIESDRIYKDHLYRTFVGLKSIRNLQQPCVSKILEKKVNLPRPIGYERRKTIIFDLDETLVHCVGNNAGDVAIEFKFEFGKTVTAGVNVRPFVKECLKEASKLFEVVIFTASHKSYADAILDYLDPDCSMIHHRLYRNNCIKINNFNIKDLRVINRKIQDIIIVDNTVSCFAFHLDNGVPIISWYNDRNDRQLINLIEYFIVVADSQDVREINREIFHLDTFYDDYLYELSNNSKG